MRFALLGLGCLLFLFQYAQVNVNAFTIGSLLPSYICGPTAVGNAAVGDNYPRSLFGWLSAIGSAAQVFVPTGLPPAGTRMIGRMTNPLINATAVVDPAVRVDYATDLGTVENTKSLVANWHNHFDFNKCANVIFVSVALTNQPGVTGMIVPAQNHTLTLTVNGQDGNPNCDPYQQVTQVQPADIENVALDGAVVYGVIPPPATATTTVATRVGSFVAFGPADATTMEPWAACGANNVGIVHNQLISDAGQYTGIVWQAPATLKAAATVTFQGAAVSDVGFGPHRSDFTVADITVLIKNNPTLKLNVAQPIITKVAEMGKNLGVFFNSQAKNALANVVVVPTSFLVKATVAGTTVAQVTVKQSPANLPITAAMKGQTVSVTVTASNNNANSVPTTSGTFSIFVPAGNKNTAINLDVVLSLCPANVQIERALYNEDLDSDYQCATQTDLLLQNGTVAFIQETVVAGAAQQSPAIALITLFAVAVAALARKL